VKDASGNALACVHGRESTNHHGLPNASPVAMSSNIAKLPTLLGATEESELDFPEGGG
jgi:hypothetical protein